MEPNALFDNDFKFDCSGLVLRYTSENENVWVSEVFEDSPADQVDVQEGDILKAVNFTPVFSLDLVEIREILMNPGETIALEIERNGKIIQRTVVLESLI